MAIGITTILTITFLLGSLNGFMPRVSYPKALDWYLLVSFTLTFLSLVECMIVFVVSMSENKEHDDQVWLIVFVSLYFLGPVHMYLFLSENRDFLSLSKKKTVHTLCFIILFARPHENPIATENGTHLDGNMRIHWQLSLWRNIFQKPLFSFTHTSTGKHCLQNLHTGGRFFKRCVFGDCLHWKRADGGPNRRKKSPFSNRNWYV